jgi:hypothetical protein
VFQPINYKLIAKIYRTINNKIFNKAYVFIGLCSYFPKIAHSMKQIFTAFLVINLMYFSPAFNQIPKESWRDHLAYNRGVRVAITPTKVFYAAYKSGMLSFNRKTGEIEKYSKVTGLSDINITALQYSVEKEILIIGYGSGNIDILTHKDKINIPDIERKRMISTKNINKIFCYNNYAYLACDFGIVVLDLDKYEIKDSYIFGPGGNTIKVNDITISNNFIYAATEFGLYKADLNSTNLLDFSNWELQTDLPDYNLECVFISTFNDKLLAVNKSDINANNRVILKVNSTWNYWNGFQDTIINGLDVYNNKLSIIGKNKIIFYDSEFQQSSYDVPSARHAQIADDGIVYTAGLSYGFYMFEGTEGRYLGVKNPRFNTTGKVATDGDYVWVGSGGPFNIYSEGGAHIFNNEQWTSVNNGYTAGLENVGNLYKFAFDPDDPTHVYASGYAYGIYEFRNMQVVKSYTWADSPFKESIGYNVGVRAMGIDFDKDHNLWAIMDETDQPVYVLRNNGEWENIVLKSSIFLKNNLFVALTVTSNNQIWILSKSNGVAVLKEENGKILETSFALKNQNGDLLTAAYCMTEDKNGDLWIGTNKGPIYFTPSDDIFTNDNIHGNQVIIPRNDGENTGDYLLDYEIINDIAMDGGNRKWIATENSGVFLVSSDGLKTYHNFTFENDRLISNNVIGIGVQEKTGEVFMSTNKGIVSYMGTSNEGNDDYSNVHAFPNPVRPDYTGPITITGLIANSNVKITDIAGNIVYETTSQGGQASWDGKNFSGQRVSTGVYLVFLINEDGSKTHVTKILFIH